MHAGVRSGIGVPRWTIHFRRCPRAAEVVGVRLVVGVEAATEVVLKPKQGMSVAGLLVLGAHGASRAKRSPPHTGYVSMAASLGVHAKVIINGLGRGRTTVSADRLVW
jgi:hypothetical protein